MADTTLDARQAYKKADSILEFSGSGADAAAVLARITALSARLDALVLDPYRRQIIQTACADLLTNPAPVSKDKAGRFYLRPHIVEEIRRINDDRLADYLFYRYRYDVFPAVHKIDAFPPCVQIEPTSICNYRCVFCYQTDKSFTQGRHGHMGMMSLDTFRSVVDQIEGEVEAVTLASRGEPLMCRDIKEMLGYLQGKFLGLKMNTNAWFLTEELAHAILQAGLNTLVFSVDAAEPELYARLRVNGKLERVLANIRMFSDIRRKHYSDSKIITRASGVHFSDEQDFDQIQAFWLEHVDQVAFVEYNPWENAYEAPARGIEKPCSDLWRRMFVWWDGRANPCDVDYKSHLSPGNVAGGSVSELWRSDAYEDLRRRHLEGERGGISPCSGCVVI